MDSIDQEMSRLKEDMHYRFNHFKSLMSINTSEVSKCLKIVEKRMQLVEQRIANPRGRILSGYPEAKAIRQAYHF